MKYKDMVVCIDDIIRLYDFGLIDTEELTEFVIRIVWNMNNQLNK